MSETEKPALDFIRARVAEDVAAGRNDGRVVTRFPPEPNGFLHIGHAKSICLNFGIAAEYGGKCHLRFDDTNPLTEDERYVEGIKRDVKWLGFDWGENLFHASDYFDRLYGWAVELIEAGKAYVCTLSEDEFSADYRGTVKTPGKPSPHRDRPVAESLDLFERMRRGEFDEGSHVLRAKIDMASKNMKMRDPPIFRIKKASHYRMGDEWCIYPMYDFAHCLSDAIEGITHSLCTLEFENNRELYDWYVDNVSSPSKPVQIEFARLNLTHTVMSKRLLLQLVNEGLVNGWDDPRMPTICGMRRRGYPPEAIRELCNRVGVAKYDASTVEMKLLEHILRDELNPRVPRAMGVIRPLKLVITNYPEDGEDEFDCPRFPDDPPRMGSRKVPFSREVWIEDSDFLEQAPKKYYRLKPGQEVRLRWAYLVTCTGCKKDEAGNVIEVHATYDPDSRGGNPADGRKVRGTIHWVSAKHAVDAEVRLYDHLFAAEKPGAGDRDWKEELNPASLEVVTAKVEPSLADLEPGERMQLERTGYFCADPDSAPGRPVLNRTVALRDSWAKQAGK